MQRAEFLFNQLTGLEVIPFAVSNEESIIPYDEIDINDEEKPVWKSSALNSHSAGSLPMLLSLSGENA